MTISSHTPAGRLAAPRTDELLPLTALPGGTAARLRESDLRNSDQDLLTALGLTPDCRLTVCKTGSPCIVEVRGVRVGLSEAIAERLLVEPVDESAPDLADRG